MIRQNTPAPRSILKVVGFPGGLARQFRVQYFDHHELSWRMYATYGHRDAAEECSEQLARAGRQARVVDYALCPTGI